MVGLPESIEHLFPDAIPLVDYTVSDVGSGSLITQWNTDKLGPQPTGQELAAVTQEQINAVRLTKLRTAAKQFHDDQQAQNLALRAVVKLMVDENNLLRQWMADFKAAVAAAGSLAALKTGVAGLPNVPQRTYQQAKTAINTLVDGE